jgi:diguanylate cyclase (GGDEF)-like protein
VHKPPLLLPDADAPSAQSVVAVMLSNAADFRVLSRSITHLCAAPSPGKIAEISFDLCIVDLKTLLRFETEIRALRSRAAPVLKPVLLAASESELKTANSLLGDLAEDVIRTPIRPVELTARVDNLLRLGKLSESQKRETESTEIALKGATRALRAFTTCNEHVIRARSETEVFTGTCDSLVKDGGYALAYVGEAQAYGNGDLKPLAMVGDFRDRINDIDPAPHPHASDKDPISLSLNTGHWHQSTLSDTAGIPPSQERPGETRHLKSVIVFPLTIRSQKSEAYLAIYSEDTGRFDEAEIELLQRMVENILHGIRALREKSRRRRSEKKAYDMAYRDALTGLANRSATLEAIDRHLRLTGPLPPAAGLLYLDVDGFKLINDALGHDTGDDVLIQIAQRLVSAVRESDLVARQGGDEFIILAPYDAQDSLSTIESPELTQVMSAIAERILDAMSQPFHVRGREYHLGASIGISLCPDQSSTAGTLLARADSAMYQAKNVGGNSYRFFSCELSQKQQHRLDIENRLYTAVMGGEFEMAYQPLIDLASSRTVGVEALIRWPQSDGSYISPGEFIPIAEETGLIIHIGDWVMKEALTALHRWRLKGHSQLQMAVNLAIGQLWQPSLVQGIVDQLEELQIPPSALKVELTEGSLMSDVQRMEGIVKEFREADIEVAIDDFGTGYSSLARLSSLQITTLKIDRSFLFGTPENQSAVKMVNTITQMAKSLDIEALAEGIETEAQWRMLQNLGCPKGQGFYFARPMTENALLAHLAAEN